jgi:putative inorganic carbon (HCO3(-)) transporter
MSEAVLALDVTNSVQGRWELWQRGIYMIQDFPFTGVGLGMFTLVGNLLYPLFIISEYPEHAHNIYLQAAIEHGLPGLIAFAALFMLLVCMVIQAIRRSRVPIQRALALGLLGTLVVYLLHGIVDSITAYARAGIIVWGVMGMMVALWLYTHDASEHQSGG